MLRTPRLPLWQDWAFVGFCFAKIAWQFAAHAHDGHCFIEQC